jgi:hypothetical protein
LGQVQQQVLEKQEEEVQDHYPLIIYLLLVAELEELILKELEEVPEVYEHLILEELK